MTTAAQFVDAARAEVGYFEMPVNRTKFAAEAGHANGQPWCATFVVAMARRVGLKLPSESAYTPAMYNGFRAAATAYRHGAPRPGDVVFFDFPDSVNRIQHVGICVSATATSVTCIEGNTSPGTAGSQSNGGGVFGRTRPRSHVVGYGRPAFAAASPVSTAPTPVGPPLEIDVQLQPMTLNIATDGNGNGWTKISVPIERVVGVKAHSGTRPAVDGRYDAVSDSVTVTPEDGGTLFVIRGGNPSGVAPIWFHVIL